MGHDLLEGDGYGELDHAEMANALEYWGENIWGQVRERQLKLGIDPTDTAWSGFGEDPCEIIDFLAQRMRRDHVETHVRLGNQCAAYHRHIADREAAVREVAALRRQIAELQARVEHHILEDQLFSEAQFSLYAGAYPPADPDFRLDHLLHRWGCAQG